MPDTPHQFLIGWRKLPDELKVEILGYALPSGDYLLPNPFRRELYRRDSVCLRNHVRPILACPEIAALGLEVLYKQNVLFFDNIYKEEPLLLPPKPLRKHVHCWYAQLNIEQVGSSNFNMLATNQAGFPAMKSITLFIQGIRSQDQELTDITASTRLRLSDMDTIRFNTKELKITYNTWHDERGSEEDDLDDMLPGLFTIAGNRECVKQVCERRCHTVENEVPEAKVVERWPATLDPNEYARDTTFIVWR